MVIHTASCKDPVTNMELIATDCTFNEACSYLASKCDDPCEECIALSDTTTKLVFKTRVFYYDEDRGYLLGA